MEKLSVKRRYLKNVTASAAGTAERPEKNVQQKAGLNREIPDTAPAWLMALVSYKGGSLVAGSMRRRLDSSKLRRPAPRADTVPRRSCHSERTPTWSEDTASLAMWRLLESSTLGCVRSFRSQTKDSNCPARVLSAP